MCSSVGADLPIAMPHKAATLLQQPLTEENPGGFNQGRFEPETNRYYESPGPRQTPAEMLPRKAQALEATIR